MQMIMNKNFILPCRFKLLLNLNLKHIIIRMVFKKLHARQIFDSRGNPTVEVDLVTDKGKSDFYITGQVVLPTFEGFSLLRSLQSCCPIRC